jgi:dephospho-CoA kinase
MERDRCGLRGVLVAGITGGLATGKSTVTRLLRGRGVTVFSADEAARATLTPAVLEAIAAAFGPEIRLPDGSLDRARLGAHIFADPDARERLNRITHPPILRLLRAQIESACDDLSHGAIVGVEVPLLYETELSGWFHCVIVVSASEAVQVARLGARNGLAESEARRRIAAQMPLAEKEARADYILRNDGTPRSLERAVDDLLARLLGRDGVSS